VGNMGPVTIDSGEPPTELLDEVHQHLGIVDVEAANDWAGGSEPINILLKHLSVVGQADHDVVVKPLDVRDARVDRVAGAEEEGKRTALDRLRHLGYHEASIVHDHGVLGNLRGQRNVLSLRNILVHCGTVL